MRFKPELVALWNERDLGGIVQFYNPRLTWVPRVEVDWLGWLCLAIVTLAAVYCAWRSWRAFHPRHRGIPWRISPEVTVDLQPTPTDTIHGGVVAFSGSGKSTAVLGLLDNPDHGGLVIALDNCRPIANKFRYEQARGNKLFTEWSNERGSPGFGVGLDMLQGPAEVASEVLVAGWAAKSSGDTGKYRRSARFRIWHHFDELAAADKPRTFAGVIAALRDKTGDKEEDRACTDWAMRLVILQKTLGASLGNELDLVQAMRDKRKILLRLNRYIAPEDAPMLGGMLLIHARMTAQLAGIPFVCIVEEAGQMGDYADHMTPLAQAGRDRQVPLIVITQNGSRLKPEVVTNTKVWLIGAQEDDTEIKFGMARMRFKAKDDPDILHVESFKHEGKGWFWVRAPGLKPTLTRATQQLFGHVLPVPDDAHDFMPTEYEQGHPDSRGHTEVLEWPTWAEPALQALPAPSRSDLAFLSRFEMTPTCWLWEPGNPKGCDRDGYGIVSIDGKQQRVHRLMYERAYGVGSIGFEPSGKPMEIDHLCYNRRCGRPEHLERVTHAENMRRMHARRGHKVKPREAAAV